MRIAFFTDTYHPSLNGVTVSLDHFTQTLEELGHKVVIFAPQVKNYVEENPRVVRISSIKVLSSEPEIRFPLPTSATTIKEIAKLEFDIIHAHGNGPFSLLGYQVARMKGVPYVMTFHNLHTKYTHYFLKGKVVKPRMIATGMRVFANLCDGVLVPSRKMQLELESYGVTKKIYVIPNFVPFEKFDNQKKNSLHALLSLSSNTPLVLSVGRLGIEKNFPFLLDVFKKVSLKNEAAHFVLIGKGPEKEKLIRIVKKLGLQNRIHFLENISPQQMPALYKDATLFAFASETEVHPLVILEAACAGLPLVVCNDLAYENVAIDKKNAFVLPLSVDAFTESIVNILSNNKLSKEMGEQSLSIVKSNFNGGTITHNLLSVYAEVISQQNNSGKIIRKVNKVALSHLIQVIRNINKVLN